MAYGKCKICNQINTFGAVCKNCLTMKYKMSYEEYKQKIYHLQNQYREAVNKEGQGIIIEPTDPFLSPKCHRCKKNPATEEHTCPYATDILDDHGTLCDCCDDCCQECADDI